MTTIAIIQARMGSSRLPGKVLEDLAGRPVLGWVVDAARAVPGIDEVAHQPRPRQGADDLGKERRQRSGAVGFHGWR